MPSKLFIRVEPEARFVGATDGFKELSRLPLDVGKHYLVQASGVLGLAAGVTMRMRLDVRSFFGSIPCLARDRLHKQPPAVPGCDRGERPRRGWSRKPRNPGTSWSFCQPISQNLLDVAPRPRPERLGRQDDDRGADRR
jgi:hypothetical protein